jgi:hypothetical protein
MGTVSQEGAGIVIIAAVQILGEVVPGKNFFAHKKSRTSPNKILRVKWKNY